MYKTDINRYIWATIIGTAMSNLPVYHIEDFKFAARSFYANDLVTHLKEHEFTSHSHRHDFYLTMLFTRGTGTHDVDFSRYPVKEGAVFMMAPGQFHSWQLSADAEGYVFFHTGEFYNLNFTNKQITDYPFFAFTQNVPVLYLNPEERLHAGLLFKRILEEYRKDDLGLKFRTLVALTDLLYLDLTAAYLSATPSRKDHSPLYLQKITELNRLIDEHFLTHRSAREYADLMHISAKHLNRICREILGKTTTDIIAERIVLEAKRLLVRSAKPVKEVAEELGFDDVSYFMRMFKKHTGLSPAAFTREHR